MDERADVDEVVAQAEFYESQGLAEWRAVRRAVEDATTL